MNTGEMGTNLVRSDHSLVEFLESNLDQSRVGNPSTIVSSFNLSLLVSVNLSHRLVVGGFVVLDGNLSRHSSHGGDSTSGNSKTRLEKLRAGE